MTDSVGAPAVTSPAPDRVRLGFSAVEVADDDVRGLEEAGVDSVWSAGHLWMNGPGPEPLTSLARLALLTRRAAVGTAVTVVPLYPPALLAKLTTEIDRMSGGRTILGVGVGGEFAREFEAAGVPMRERGPRTDEAIDLLRRWWSGETVDVRSRFFPAVNGLRIEPGPIQSGGPPGIIGRGGGGAGSGAG